MPKPNLPKHIQLLFLIFFIANLTIWFEAFADMSLLLASGLFIGRTISKRVEKA